MTEDCFLNPTWVRVFFVLPLILNLGFLRSLLNQISEDFFTLDIWPSALSSTLNMLLSWTSIRKKKYDQFSLPRILFIPDIFLVIFCPLTQVLHLIYHSPCILLYSELSLPSLPSTNPCNTAHSPKCNRTYRCLMNLNNNFLTVQLFEHRSQLVMKREKCSKPECSYLKDAFSC